jgi:beta-glucanase (GH16 family)
MIIKIFIRLFFFLGIYETAQAQTQAQVPETIWQVLQNGSIIRWALTFNDEFNGNQLDSYKWRTDYPWGRNYDPTTYMEYMTDGQNLIFQDGNLDLVARNDGIWARGIEYLPDDYIMQDGGQNLRWWPYTSGMIFSRRKFKYGLFEIKCTLPEGKGLWPAFWLFEGDPHEEFDIFEYKGEYPNMFHIDVHCPVGCSNFGGWAVTSGDLTSQPSVFMGEWGPEFSFWYYNYSDFSIWLGEFNQPMNLIANHGISAMPNNGNDPSFDGQPDITTPFPSAFSIDYIRVWNRLDCNSNIVMSTYSQGIDDESVITGNTVIIDNLNLNNDQYLNIIATESITINNTSNINGDFEAKIVDCPGPQKSVNNSNTFDSGSYTNNIDTLVQDSTYLRQLVKEIAENPYLYVKIFPNPTDKILTIQFDGNLKLVPTLEVLDQSGKIVKKYISLGESRIDIDVSDLLKGNYILRGTIGENIIEENLIIR